MPLLPELFQNAVNHHQAGRLDQAEQGYRQVLAEDPNHADAMHLLGVIQHQRGQHDQAIVLIDKAMALQPDTAVYHANLAEVYRVKGELERAEAHCRHALRVQPDHAEANNNLGLLLDQSGRREEALRHFEAAIERRPNWELPYNNIANTLRELSRPLDAIAFYREGIRLCAGSVGLRSSLSALLLEMSLVDEALAHAQDAARLQPTHAGVLVNLGNAFSACGRYEEARDCYARALREAPNLALAHDRLGLILHEQGRHAEAIGCFANAIAHDAQEPKYHCHLAAALAAEGRVDEAIARYRTVVSNRPDQVEAFNYLGYWLQDQGDMEGALAAYREAIQRKPDYADAYLNMGLLLTEMGELEQARDALRQALKHDPNHPEALSALGLSLRERMPPEEIAAAERVLALPRVAPNRRAVLQYGMAQVKDAQNDFARAAQLVMQANRYHQELARLERRGYEPMEHTQYVDQIIAAYSTAHFERVRDWGLNSDLPVFVVGLPRSGTTLAEQVLASHPQVHGAGELNLMRDLYQSLPNVTRKQAPGIECVGDLTRDQVRALGQRYVDTVRSMNSTARHVVDKMPDNYLMVGLIRTLLPHARIVHACRDVRDTALSMWLTHFRHLRWACDQEHIGYRIRDYLRLMEHWKAIGVPMLELRYEEMVGDLEPTARRLVEWCGLPWDPACLQFHQTKRVVRTASMTQVREPIYTRSVGRWKVYQEWIGPLLKILAIQEKSD